MLLIIDKEYRYSSGDRQERKIWLFPQEVPDMNTFNNLPGFTYCNMLSILGADEGRYTGVRIGDLRIYLSKPHHKMPDYRVSYALVD